MSCPEKCLSPKDVYCLLLDSCVVFSWHLVSFYLRPNLKFNRSGRGGVRLALMLYMLQPPGKDYRKLLIWPSYMVYNGNTAVILLLCVGYLKLPLDGNHKQIMWKRQLSLSEPPFFIFCFWRLKSIHSFGRHERLCYQCCKLWLVNRVCNYRFRQRE